MKVENWAEPSEKSLEQMKISFKSKKVFKIIVTIIFFLVLISSLGQIYQYTIAKGQGNEIISLIWLSAEKSIPTVYATAQLLLCSCLLAVIAKKKRFDNNRYRLHWTFLSLIFLYLAVDEGAAIHEVSDKVVRKLLDTQGFWHHAWTIPAIILFSLFALAYSKFTLALPRDIRLLFIFAAATFVFGAVGMELVSGKIFFEQDYSSNTPIYALVATIEEIFELMGIAIFIYALLRYLERYINFNSLLIKF